ncbi:aldose 1-epimerase family protein [Variovorax sp. M-6]|uniref:aldose 1-epimerase family protein n=1 Tax=Variovorax sp. M-6 TaxID=3233041 RepID=UPI003F9B1B33
MNSIRADSPPSGVQHEIRHGSHRAVVTEVGATLRHYSVDDVDVIDGIGVDEWSPDGRGQVLAPWPNRLDGGKYRFEGRDGQAALDEPELQNAIHGLVRWLPWRTASKSADAVELTCALHPQPGYPWRLDLQVEYRLDRTGLTVSFRVRNASSVPAPFGIGFHPYLTVGTAIDDAVLQIPATLCLVADDRGLPIGIQPVAGSDMDFTEGRPVGAMRLDTGYTDLVRGSDGLARAFVASPDGGRRVSLWADSLFRYLMVYTGDKVETVSRRRRAVAIEPMTCPPNALLSGTDLLRMEPGQVVEGRWGLIPSR